MLRAALPLSTSRLPRGKTFSYFRLSKNLSILNIVASPSLIRFITYSSYHICYAYIHICCTMYNVLSLLGTILSIYLLPFHWFSLIPSCAVQTHMHVIPHRALINSHFDSSELVDGARRFHWFIGSISILLFLTFGFCFILSPPFFCLRARSPSHSEIYNITQWFFVEVAEWGASKKTLHLLSSHLLSLHMQNKI